MSTDVVQATRRVLARRRNASVPESEWEQAGAGLSAAAAAAGAGQLREALDQDLDELLLPPELKNAMYERLLELDGRTPSTLREYAWHLQLYGPDWDDVADELIAEAERAERGGS